MNRFRNFVKTSLIGGLAVVLPLAILIFTFRWLFNLITSIIQPLTNLMMTRGHFQEMVAALLVMAIILAGCFVIGIVVKTRVGRFLHGALESRILKRAPGYTLIRDTIMQFVDQDRSPFSSAALVRIYSNETLMTAFITDHQPDGRYTVFVPTGPNPTSGNIFHLPGEYVYVIDVPIEEVMRSIISCGAGSKRLLDAYSATAGRPVKIDAADAMKY